MGQKSKPTPVIRPQQPKLQQAPAASTSHLATQNLAEKQHAQLRIKYTNHQDHPSTTQLQRPAVEKSQQQKSHGGQSQHKVASAPAVTRNPTQLQPRVSSQYNRDFPVGTKY